MPPSRVIDGFVADVVTGGRIIEVQTGGFGPLRGKLERLLGAHLVTLVHPIARDRFIVKTTNDSGVPVGRRMSPRHGSVFDVFPALVSIPALLQHPNLTLDVVMTVEEEVRAPTARRSWRRGNWARVDRRLVDVVEDPRHRVAWPTCSPWSTLICPSSSRRATSRLAMKSSRGLAQQAAYCFREAGVAEICGQGRQRPHLPPHYITHPTASDSKHRHSG